MEANEGGSRSLSEKVSDRGARKASSRMWARGGEVVVIHAGKGQRLGRGGVCPAYGGREEGPRQSWSGWEMESARGFVSEPTLPRAQRTERRAPKKMGSSAMSRRLP